MFRKNTFNVLMLLLGGIVLFWSPALVQATTHLQTATPTPAAEEEASDGVGEEVSDTVELTMAALLSRIEALEAQVTTLQDEMAEGQAGALSVDQINQVTTAVYLLDTAGLHALDVRLNEDGEILPADAGMATRVGRLLTTVNWPATLSEDAQALVGVFGDLAAALSDDDLDAAAPLATEVHDRGHELSHAAEHWMHEAIAEIKDDAQVKTGQAYRVTTAVYLLDNAGLHALDVRLNEDGEILPADAGAIARVSRLLSTVDWPEPLAEDAQGLISVFSDLAAALSDDDLEAAAPLATSTHEIGHELSHGAEHWLHEIENAESDHSSPDSEDTGSQDEDISTDQEQTDSDSDGG